MYRNIMVAVDDSKNSERALNEAIKLSKTLKAKLIITHVIDISLPDLRESPIMLLDLRNYQNLLRKKGQALLSKIEKRAKANKIKVKTELLEISDHSRVSDKILKSIKTIKPDLLVLGTHGRHGLNRFLIGSVAFDITSFSKIPILLMRDSTRRT